MIRAWLWCLSVLGVALGAMPAQAQTFPSKVVTLVVPASPGGVTDLIARALGQRLSESFGQPVVVENKPGATNQIAAESVARAAPDGYTLLVSPEATFVINPYLFAKLPYDPAKDFVPVSGLIKIQQALVTGPSIPARNIADLIALAKRERGGLNYGTYGVGSTGHLNMEMFQTVAGVNFVPIHYKGATPALTDVMAGHIQLMFISVGSAVEPWKAGKLKLLATGGKERLARLADVPTVAETIPGFEAASWFGLFAPAGTPSEVVSLLNTQTQHILGDPRFHAAVLDPQFFEPMLGSPQDFADFLKTDAEKWRHVVRAANVRIE
ncbi:MAG: Bug family tripartite tricarboxylate transporter substrate binding protein [Xanthobacteraceae bacterium]